MPRFLRIHFIAVVLLSGLAQNGALAGLDEENAIKTAMVYRLLKFVDWPTGIARNDEAFVLCTLGLEMFGGMLAGIEGRAVATRPIRIKRLESLGKANACEVLVIAAEEVPAQRASFERLSAMPLLTISDAAGFAERGGMIEISRSGSRLALRINRRRIEQAGLSVSSQVLSLATIVGEPPP